MSRLLEMRGVVKHFGRTRALDEVDLELERGEVHALVGENGAGKSTLMRILFGDLRMDKGGIFLEGELHHIGHPAVARSLGIFAVQQHFSLIPSMSVAENIFFGDHPRSQFGLVDWKGMNRKARELIDKTGFKEVNLELPVGQLSVAERQQIEIVKAIRKSPRILIMDEPSAVLPEGDMERLFSIIRELRNKGVGIIYISHHLNEVFDIADRISVLKDGQNVTTVEPSHIDSYGLVKLMVGRDVGNMFPRRTPSIGSEVLSVSNVETKELKNISFSLKSGEVLGFAGLVGSGRTELCNALFGVDRIVSGKIEINGEVLEISRPSDAIASGLGYVTEDRHNNGLILSGTVRSNVSFAGIRRVSRFGILSRTKESQSVEYYIRRLKIVASSREQILQNLSGGNQQKVVLAKWLMTEPTILLLDEPTRGIDVGAKVEIYNIINELVSTGCAVIMVSSELREIMQMTDRIIVMREGRIVGEFMPKETSEEEVIACASGLKPQEAGVN
jgi:ribose transport system ATP-binding protein